MRGEQTLYFKIKGNNKYLYALMDDETRFWIAQQVAHTKNTAGVSPLLEKGKEITKTRPKTFITDGGHNFHHLILNVFTGFEYNC